MDLLRERYIKLLRETSSDFHRYMYGHINWKSRMIGLTGPRGVGKTTLVLQYIKEKLPQNKALYISAEDLYFSSHTLLELADSFTKQGGEHLFIDEIHRYEGWSRELKLIYDYHSELQVIFTGSSVLDINKGISDLSRRAVMYNMQGLSFREYLEFRRGILLPKFTLEEILSLKVPTSIGFHPLPFFEDYLRYGYYPFSLEDHFQRVRQTTSLTLEIDIPQYAGMNVSTGRKLKQLLAIIAKSVPFKPNASSIASALGISRNSVADYCLFIEQAELISQVRDDTGGIRGLGKVEKIYIDNPSLMYSLAGGNVDIGNIRETFFYNQMRVDNEVISSKLSDFKIGTHTFEIGGRKKGNKQVEGLPDAFMVKDDIEFAFGHTIPLWHFGLNY